MKHFEGNELQSPINSQNDNSFEFQNDKIKNKNFQQSNSQMEPATQQFLQSVPSIARKIIIYCRRYLMQSYRQNFGDIFNSHVSMDPIPKPLTQVGKILLQNGMFVLAFIKFQIQINRLDQLQPYETYRQMIKTQIELFDRQSKIILDQEVKPICLTSSSFHNELASITPILNKQQWQFADTVRIFEFVLKNNLSEEAILLLLEESGWTPATLLHRIDQYKRKTSAAKKGHRLDRQKRKSKESENN